MYLFTLLNFENFYFVAQVALELCRSSSLSGPDAGITSVY